MPTWSWGARGYLSLGHVSGENERDWTKFTRQASPPKTAPTKCCPLPTFPVQNPAKNHAHKCCPLFFLFEICSNVCLNQCKTSFQLAAHKFACKSSPTGHAYIRCRRKARCRQRSFGSLSDPTDIPPYRETGVAITLLHCVFCGIADYRCYTPTSFRKSGLSQSKDRPNKAGYRKRTLPLKPIALRGRRSKQYRQSRYSGTLSWSSFKNRKRAEYCFESTVSEERTH